jgi:hypothetical protein
LICFARFLSCGEIFGARGGTGSPYWQRSPNFQAISKHKV